MLLLVILLQVKGYAVSTLEANIVALTEERAQLVTAQRELKDSFPETLGFVDEALAEIADARSQLDGGVDADAIKALDQRERELTAQREELQGRKSGADARDLQAEIQEVNRKIAAIRASIAKLGR